MKYFLTLLFTYSFLFLTAQKDYTILLSKGNILLSKDVQTEWERLKNNPQFVVNNQLYVLIQLDDIPNTEEKRNLQQQGIQLLHYIPNYAWIASISKGLTSSAIQNAKIRGISEFKSTWKMSSQLENAIIPSYAGNIELLSTRILFWKGANGSNYTSLCEAADLKVENSSSKWSWVEVNSDWKSLMEFAKHPLVQYIEFPDPPQENEFQNEITLIQSNYISNNPAQGLFFDGTGVQIAVNEGGIIDSAHQANFKGRLDRSLESGNASGHKTGVGRRMASAGNINPDLRGTAFGAHLHSGGINFSNAASNGINIINNSFGWGCIGAGTTSTYNSGAANNDNLVRTHPSFMITYSAGNMGGSDCGYGNGTAGAGWANITGLTKSGKNIFAVGALGTNGNLTGFSSRGPAWDGRILPDICATGPGGTSHASPNLAGVFAQLMHAYKSHHSGLMPKSGLLKAILMNSADDMLKPGPDFKSGYGKINARKAYHTIAQNHFLTDSITQGATNTHSITVPPNVKEVRVMVYWTDYEAVAGITSRALVNNLDMQLEDPNAVQWQPWVLNPSPDSALLELPAVRAVDSLNNVEQVSLFNPITGNYTLRVNGSMVPQGPQEYFVVYEYIFDELWVTYPLGGEHFTPNTNQRIRWDSQGDSSNTFDLFYSIDNGVNWSTIVTGLAANNRFYDWTVPDSCSSQALIRVDRGALTAVSDTTFHILASPQNLAIIWSCGDSSLLTWDSIPNADGYILYKLGAQYMDSIAYTSATSIILNNLSLLEADYLAIAAVKNNALSQRSIAIERSPTNFNCMPNDIALTHILAPGGSALPSCLSNQLTIKVNVRNLGVNALHNIPIAYSLDGAAPIFDTITSYLPTGATAQLAFSSPINLSLGHHSLDVWTHYPADGNLLNDSLSDSLVVYNNSPATLPLMESFDSFITCSTAWGCEMDTCNLTQGWYNLSNLQDDDIDWRTDANGTATGGTGPSGDHSSSTGNYLYLEGSGNSGSGCINKEAILHSPCIDLSNSSQASASFWYHAYGSSIGALHVDVVADGHLHKDVIAPIVGNQGDQWDSLFVDLSAFVGQQIIIVIRGYTGNGYRSDLAIDDINISAQQVITHHPTTTKKQTLINVFPNPNNGQLNIDLGNSTNKATVQTFNTLGKNIHQQIYQNQQLISLTINQPAGMYMVCIKTDDGETHIFKIIKRS
ncbi:S8 family serine peptidase [Aureispira anguillae]|uniref:S8 family serine peptidase n=1 Tax=Aureispira anguillae TaxID=2864201 RepID=A0A915YDV2_9BACT|nr:S8 family serine peptidase [Aureispira anguillae]BDS11273.1 S8 family serine peptidase [Aureispira anguillae]